MIDRPAILNAPEAFVVVPVEPFAKRAGMLDGIWNDHETQWSPEYGNTAITIGHLRAASTALVKIKETRNGTE